MGAVSESRWLTMAGWDDVPHLTEQAKRELLESTPPHLRDARSKGLPSLGSGAIYPIARSEIEVPFFAIPAWWPRAYAMDVGWNRTAALWCAWDPDTWVAYLYAEHYRGRAEPPIHAEAIKARGHWVHGVGDAAATSQADGEQMLQTYRDLGLHLTLANKSVEAGIYAVWIALSTGRLKVMQHLNSWFAEYMIYRRDENGKIIKADDHLMDCTRYLMMSGRAIARQKPPEVEDFAPGSGGDGVIGY